MKGECTVHMSAMQESALQLPPLRVWDASAARNAWKPVCAHLQLGITGLAWHPSIWEWSSILLERMTGQEGKPSPAK